MSRDQLLYVADMVSAGEAVLRYTDGIAFEVFVGNDDLIARGLDRMVATLFGCSGPYRFLHGQQRTFHILVPTPGQPVTKVSRPHFIG